MLQRRRSYVNARVWFCLLDMLTVVYYSYYVWLGGVVVSVSDSWSRGRGFNSRPVHRQATTLGKLLTPMCLCHQAVQSGSGQRAVMLCGREGNCRSGVALAMRHRLQWFIHLHAQRPRKGTWAPHLHSMHCWGTVHFTLSTVLCSYLLLHHWSCVLLNICWILGVLIVM